LVAHSSQARRSGPFPTHIVSGAAGNQLDRQYDVASDGQFLRNTELGSAAAPITLLRNWLPEAKK